MIFHKWGGPVALAPGLCLTEVSVADNQPHLSSKLSGGQGEAVPLLRVNWSILNFANRPTEREGEGRASRAGEAVTQAPVPSPSGFDWG